MKGFIALRSFYHTKQFNKGDKVEGLNESDLKQLEKKGLIRWMERPKIIIRKKVVKPEVVEPEKKPSKKKYVRKSTKDV